MRFLYDVIDQKPLPQSYLVHFGGSKDHLGALSGPSVKNQFVRRHRTGATFFYNGLKPMSTLCSHELIANCSFLYDVIYRKPLPRPPYDPCWATWRPTWGHLGAILGPSSVILRHLGQKTRSKSKRDLLNTHLTRPEEQAGTHWPQGAARLAHSHMRIFASL